MRKIGKIIVTRIPPLAHTLQHVRLVGLSVLAWFASAVAAILSLIVAIRPGLAPGDALLYTRMAQAPTHFTKAPWGYRIMTPWLVHVLPLPTTEGFLLITILGLAGAATAIGYLCRAIGLSGRSCIAAGALFLLSYASVFDIVDFRLIDPLAYCGTALFLLALIRDRLSCAGLCILATTMDKEWGLFLIGPLVIMLWRRRQHPRSVCIPIALGVVAPVLAYLLVRHWPGFGDRDYTRYYSLDLLQRMVALHHSDLLPSLLDAGLLVWLIAPLGWRQVPAPLRAATTLVPAAAIQILFATDAARMLAYAIIPLLPLALSALDRLPLWRWAFSITLLGLCGARLFLTLIGYNASRISFIATIIVAFVIISMQIASHYARPHIKPASP